jgi:hypothetical protein
MRDPIADLDKLTERVRKIEKKKAGLTWFPIWVSGLAAVISLASFFMVVNQGTVIAGMNETVRISRADIEDLQQRTASPPEPQTIIPPKKLDSIDRVRPTPKTKMTYSTCGRTGGTYWCQ